VNPHASALAALGVAGPARERIATYLDLVASWGARVNLTGARSATERVAILVAPVLAAAELVSGRLLDVGSGNGSPGMVLALLRPEVGVTLLEPRLKRWAFLREVARATGREALEVLRARHDEYAGPSATTVTVRALALSLAELAPLVTPDGRLLVFGPTPAGAPHFVAEASAGASFHVLRRSRA
jgi:16S rRNA (guanine527-N7)-methyltransferase